MRITESKWQEIKEFLDHCESARFVAAHTGASQMTVSRVKRTASYEEYKELAAKQSVKRNATNGEPESKTIIVSFDQMKAIAKDVDEIKRGLGLLCEIAANLLDCWRADQ
jgi:DNA-binding MurR/RpiR family transcriptional regulator